MKITPLRKQISIEELKERKRNLDAALSSLTLSEHAKEEIRCWAELTDTAIFYHAKWKQEEQKNEKLTALNRELMQVIKETISLLKEALQEESWEIENNMIEYIIETLEEKAKGVR
ncbi:MAG: hypothetical protein H0Z24_07000 [Thermosipho sp. (in: Bacteria)]|nr:hypothetical protein [Thermosipho sp. (in: thermotogales)]